MTEHSTHDPAGAGPPAPAVVSAATGTTSDAVRPASADVVPPEARTELDRIRRRWGELPLARAEGRMPLLRHLLADLATRSAPGLIASHPPHGGPSGHQEVGDSQSVGPVVPDLGPGVVVDQLTVLVWDAYANGRGDGIPDLLTDLRRALA